MRWQKNSIEFFAIKSVTNNISENISFFTNTGSTLVIEVTTFEQAFVWRFSYLESSCHIMQTIRIEIKGLI